MFISDLFTNTIRCSSTAISFYKNFTLELKNLNYLSKAFIFYILHIFSLLDNRTILNNFTVLSSLIIMLQKAAY